MAALNKAEEDQNRRAAGTSHKMEGKQRTQVIVLAAWAKIVCIVYCVAASLQQEGEENKLELVT